MIRPEPIFILSAPRSGSTLLRVMLAGHSELFCPPELNLAEFETLQRREAVLGPCPHSACQEHLCDQRAGLQQALMELRGCDSASSRAAIEEMLGRDTSIAEVYAQLIDLAAPRTLVDKSPRYTQKLISMEKALRLFPRANFIYLHRHPQAVIESLVRNGFEGKVTLAEQVWFERNNNINAFLASVPARQQFSLAYETLVKQPDVIMRQLCDFLQISFDPALLTPYEGSRMTNGIQPGRMPPGDPNFLKHKVIDPGLTDAWRELNPCGAISDATKTLSTRLMYETI